MRIIQLCRVALLSSLALLAACTPNLSNSSYTTQNAGAAESVIPGKIVSMRIVQVGSNNGVGGLAGAVAGAAGGSMIGGGTRANVIGGVAGALAGGLLGNEAQKRLSTTNAVQYIVKTHSGKMIAIVQAVQPSLMVGQRVLVIMGNPSRVIADTQ